MAFRFKLKFTYLRLLNTEKRNLCSKIESMALYEPIFVSCAVCGNDQQKIVPILQEVKPPEIPMYDLINLHFRGYDYVVLEKYHKYVIDVLRLMNIDLANT